MSVLTHFAFTSLGQSALTSNLDVMLRILGLGTIGLGFLLAFLAFRLLNREQNIKAPRDMILTSITRFMIFSFLLCALGLFSEIWRNYAPKPASEPLGGALYWLPPEETQAATQVAQKFLEQIDAGQIQEAYDANRNGVRPLFVA